MTRKGGWIWAALAGWLLASAPARAQVPPRLVGVSPNGMYALMDRASDGVLVGALDRPPSEARYVDGGAASWNPLWTARPNLVLAQGFNSLSWIQLDGAQAQTRIIAEFYPNKVSASADWLIALDASGQLVAFHSQGPPVQLVAAGAAPVFGFEVSASGRAVYSQRQAGPPGNAWIETHDLANGNKRKLHTRQELTNLAISPDGRLVAGFLLDPGERSRWILWNVEGGSVDTLTFDPYLLRLDLSTSPESGADPSRPRFLPGDPGVRSASFSPDGKRLVISNVPSGFMVFEVAAAGGARHHFSIPVPGWANHGHHSHRWIGGQLFGYTLPHASGSPALWKIDLATRTVSPVEIHPRFAELMAGASFVSWLERFGTDSAGVLRLATRAHRTSLQVYETASSTSRGVPVVEIGLPASTLFHVFDDGRYVVAEESEGASGSVRVYDSQNGSLVRQGPPGSRFAWLGSNRWALLSGERRLDPERTLRGEFLSGPTSRKRVSWGSEDNTPMQWVPGQNSLLATQSSRVLVTRSCSTLACHLRPAAAAASPVTVSRFLRVSAFEPEAGVRYFDGRIPVPNQEFRVLLHIGPHPGSAAVPGVLLFRWRTYPPPICGIIPPCRPAGPPTGDEEAVLYQAFNGRTQPLLKGLDGAVATASADGSRVAILARSGSIQGLRFWEFDAAGVLREIRSGAAATYDASQFAERFPMVETPWASSPDLRVIAIPAGDEIRVIDLDSDRVIFTAPLGVPAALTRSYLLLHEAFGTQAQVYGPFTYGGE